VVVGPRAARAILLRIGRWLIAWLLFRLMLESGAVKLLAMDDSWHHLTALGFHFWTQPLPGPWAWYVHHLPPGSIEPAAPSCSASNWDFRG
jgi:hypothetical protein